MTAHSHIPAHVGIRIAENIGNLYDTNVTPEIVEAISEEGGYDDLPGNVVDAILDELSDYGITAAA